MALTMPTYNDLRPPADFAVRDYELVFPEMKTKEKRRTIENLLELRSELDLHVPPRKAEHNLIVASWNIKELGHTTQRLPEAFFYMAEIIARFDLLVVQEIKSSLGELDLIMRLLGDDWSMLVNDITGGRDGNSERSAYLFNTKRVEFAGLAGEIALWDDLTKNSQIKQLKRTPYITGFRAAWKTFAIVNLHLHPGKTDEDLAYRREEVRLLLAAIGKKLESGHLWNENLILAGDFNLYAGQDKDDATIALIEDAGFQEVDGLKGQDTNASKTEAYDRLFLSSEEYFKVAVNPAGKGNGGVFDVFDVVFKDGGEQEYLDDMKRVHKNPQKLDQASEAEKYYKRYWRRNQMSDHFPIWIELLIDSSDDFLTSKLGGW